MGQLGLFLAVGIGGAVGAALRYAVEKLTVATLGSGWPWGTWIVNVAGSVVLGALTGTVLSTDLSTAVSLLLGTGLCGALTTFSSFALQIVDLSRPAGSDRPALWAPRAWAYAAISLGSGLLAALSIPMLVDALG